MNEFFKRVFTSSLLLIILYFSIINKIFLAAVLLIILYVLFTEFHNIIKKILIKNKLFQIILLIFVLIYLYYFSISIFFFINSDNPNNIMMLLFLFTICISTDIGGYIFGKTFKGKKLTKISPNKTYAGLIGSFLLSILFSIIFFRNLDLIYNYLLITIFISFISQAGDLFISYLKRKAKVKDTGNFLPGHGGLLDRLDGILLALPIGIVLLS